MRHYVSSILAIMLCLFFLVAGTGYNVVHYCCHACRVAGVEHVEECEEHHSETSGHHDATCGCSHHHHSHHGTCWFRHLQLDEGGISSSLHLPDIQSMQTLHCIVPLHVSEQFGFFSRTCSFFTDSSPEKSVGQAIHTMACQWIL